MCVCVHISIKASTVLGVNGKDSFVIGNLSSGSGGGGGGGGECSPVCVEGFAFGGGWLRDPEVLK